MTDFFLGKDDMESYIFKTRYTYYNKHIICNDWGRNILGSKDQDPIFFFLLCAYCTKHKTTKIYFWSTLCYTDFKSLQRTLKHLNQTMGNPTKELSYHMVKFRVTMCDGFYIISVVAL